MKRLIILGVIVHVLLLFSVFDIYFVSPIQHGMIPQKSRRPPPSKRLVLFVADGLRAESLYNPEMPQQAPFLFSIKESIGTSGISHTQVPTESRPGHIAMLAGFNEDPSAVTRGWKHNPVDFDSVINQSTNAWCWGSPDIVNMFNKFDLPHIRLESYSAAMQDFSGSTSPSTLDVWVFEKVQKFLGELQEMDCGDFCKDGNILFLHLLGLDTAGHSIKPTSKEYIDNIKIVDRGVRNMVELIENFFNDYQTTYIFTADHGMTDWGSHGAGSKHETEVPILAWGAAIEPNQYEQNIQQVDIAPLISTLIGINIPINSVGIVPLDFLNLPLGDKAHIIAANARQLSQQYITKHINLKSTILSWAFQPFSELPEKIFYGRLYNLDSALKLESFEQAITFSRELICLLKKGLQYYNNYYQNILLFLVSFGFVGWILYLFISINVNTIGMRNHEPLQLPIKVYIGAAILYILCLVPFVRSLPYTYFLYCLFPFLTWLALIRDYKLCLARYYLLRMFNLNELLFTTSLYLGGTGLLMLSFYNEYFLTVILTYLMYINFSRRHLSGEYLSPWIIQQVILITCMVTLKSYDLTYLLVSCLLWVLCAYHTLLKPRMSVDFKVLKVQFSLLILAFINNMIVQCTLRMKFGLLFINQLISWLILPISLVLPLFVSTLIENRMTSVIVALMTPYTLLSVGTEHLCMFVFSQHMLTWILMVHRRFLAIHRASGHVNFHVINRYYTDFLDLTSQITKDSIEFCFTLLAYIMLSFFGVGNSASFNSFDPMWASCFVTIFSPFTMSALIIFKLILPFVIVMCAFRAIMIVGGVHFRNCFLIIQLLCDLMVIQFLYLVQNEGSWLDIGLSLSRFIIANLTTIALLLLYEAADFFTSYRQQPNKWTNLIVKLIGVYEQYFT